MAVQEQAFRTVMAHRTMLKVYILSIVHDVHLAEDILSEVTLTIVNTWDRYDPGRAFGPWARGIAWRVAMATLRKQRRQVVCLDKDVLEKVGRSLTRNGDESRLEEMKQQLGRCLDKLPESRRELIDLRYFRNKSYDDIADLTGRTLAALYMLFSRIHRQLAHCVRRAL